MRERLGDHSCKNTEKIKTCKKLFNFVIQITHEDFRILASFAETTAKKEKKRKYYVHCFSLQ